MSTSTINESREINMYNMKIADIIQEAAELHDREVNQKYDDHPYSYHLNMVVFNVANYFFDLPNVNTDDYVPIIFGAAFHDSIEDARLTYNDVVKRARKYMSDDKAKIAADIVYAVTTEKGMNRNERANDKYYEGIRNTKYAPFIKMCDRLANMTYSINKGSKMADTYRNELNHFIENVYVENEVPEKLITDIKNL